MKKGIKQNTIKNSIKVLIAVLALFLFNIDAKAEVTFTQNFNYTGGQQSLTVPYQGLYKLETWGAQGGSQTGVAEQSGYTSTIAGGYGGYSTGYVFLNAGEVIYINVGGQGGNITGRGYGGS